MKRRQERRRAKQSPASNPLMLFDAFHEGNIYIIQRTFKYFNQPIAKCEHGLKYSKLYIIVTFEKSH